MPESNNLTERKRIALKCTPLNPICLVWLNRLGGWSYWVFTGKSKINRDLTRKDDYVSYESDLKNSMGDLHGRGGEDQKRMKLSASHLKEDELNGLLEIVTSPIVYHYEQNGKKFEVVPSKLNLTYDIDNTVNTIEFEISYPSYKSQKI